MKQSGTGVSAGDPPPGGPFPAHAGTPAGTPVPRTICFFLAKRSYPGHPKARNDTVISSQTIDIFVQRSQPNRLEPDGFRSNRPRRFDLKAESASIQ
jgi:hypothetical protein